MYLVFASLLNSAFFILSLQTFEQRGCCRLDGLIFPFGRYIYIP